MANLHKDLLADSFYKGKRNERPNVYLTSNEERGKSHVHIYWHSCGILVYSILISQTINRKSRDNCLAKVKIMRLKSQGGSGKDERL